jgi:hypothetical protein
MERKAKSDYQVKQAQVPNGGKSWYIIGRPNGQRKRAWFATKAEAQAEAQERNIAIQRFGEYAVTLSGVLAHMAMECQTRLMQYGKSIQDPLTITSRCWIRPTVPSKLRSFVIW